MFMEPRLVEMTIAVDHGKDDHSSLVVRRGRKVLAITHDPVLIQVIQSMQQYIEKLEEGSVGMSKILGTGPEKPGVSMGFGYCARCGGTGEANPGLHPVYGIPVRPLPCPECKGTGCGA